MRTPRAFGRLVLGAPLLALAVGQASAQSSMTSVSDDQLIASYVAFIGPQDVYNSSGDRLKKPWQVIRQDRANFHRFGIQDQWDENDPFFEDVENRATMELRNGEISREAARDVVRGGALVLIEVFGSGSTGHYIAVTTAR